MLLLPFLALFAALEAVRLLFGREAFLWTAAAGVAVTLLWLVWSHYRLWRSGEATARLVIPEVVLFLILIDFLRKALS